MSTQPIALKQQRACDNCGMNGMCLPLGLRPDDLQRFVDISKNSVVIQASQNLFTQGEPLNNVYAVRSGLLKTVVADDNGKQRVTGFYLPGELIGLDGIHCRTHLSTATAVDTSSYCSIDFDKLVMLSTQLPALHQQLLTLMSKDIAKSSHINYTLPAHKQIAIFIQQLSQRYEARGYSATQLPLLMAQRDIASYLNLTPETVSRTFKRLKDNNIIHTERKRLSIVSLDALNDFIMH